MLPVVITPELLSEDWSGEVKSISEIVKGVKEPILPYIHIRKKGCCSVDLESYITLLKEDYPCQYLTMNHDIEMAKKMGLGGVHLTYADAVSKCKLVKENPQFRYSVSCHTFEEVDTICNMGLFDYLFLSPVFDSISKKGYSKAFDFDELKSCILSTKTSTTKIVALGGVDLDNISKLKYLGFDGVALLGAVWGDEVDCVGTKYNKLKEEWLRESK